MKIMITGGGTGGHVYPAIAVVKGLRRSPGSHEIMYLGSKKGIESNLIENLSGIYFRSTSIRGFSRESIWELLKAVIVLPRALIQGLREIIVFDPDVIYGTGGYVSFPASFWGVFLDIPVVLHELNVKPGLTNRLLFPVVDKIILSYRETVQFLSGNSTKVTGTPVRDSLLKQKEDPHRHFGLDPNKRTVFVSGGTHGSKVILDKLRTDLSQGDGDDSIQFLIQTGLSTDSPLFHSWQDEHPQKIKVVDYIERMDLAYQVADVAICRGGASTMAELIATRTPALIVPWSGSSAGHQFCNARLLDKLGAARCVPENMLESFSFTRFLSELIDDDRCIESMITAYDELNGRSATEAVISQLTKMK